MSKPIGTFPDFFAPGDDFYDIESELPTLPSYHAEPVFGGARLATVRDVQRLTGESARRVPGLGLAHGSLLGVDAEAGRPRLVHDRTLWLPDGLLHRHLLAVGPLGSGKTMRVVFPLAAAAAARSDTTLVVFDPKAELFAPLRKLAIDAGRPASSVMRLNLTDPRRSIGWSPISRRPTRAEALAVAHPLAMATSRPNAHESLFWTQAAVDIYVAILRALGKECRASLPLLRDVLDLPRREFVAWLAAREQSVPEVAAFAQFLASGSHNAETVLADARARLTPLLDDDVATVLSHPELDLHAVFRRPRVLVVEMPETSLARLRPLYGLLAGQLLDAAIEVADSTGRAALPHPAMLIVDELGNLGPIPDFPVRLNTLRSRRVSVVGAVQTLDQLAITYGPASSAVLTGFASKVFLPGVEPADAAYASERSGTTTVRITRASELPIARPLLTPEEVMRPRRHAVLGRPMTFLLADEAPFQGWVRPAFERGDLAAALAVEGSRVGRRRHRRERATLSTDRGAGPERSRLRKP